MNKFFLYTVIIYTLSWCPYCFKAKDLLDKRGIKYTEIDVQGYSDEQKAELAKKSGGRKTVPQIFINDQWIGGCDDLYELDEKNEWSKYGLEVKK